MTLTEAAAYTKKGMIGLAIFLTIALVGWLSYQYYYYSIYLPSLPKTVEQPTTKFGPLPKPSFSPTPGVSSANFSYTIDTKTGDLPRDIPSLIKIYNIPQRGASLLASNKAKNLAASFKFNSGPEILKSTIYRFTDENNGQFVMDLNSGNFLYEHRLFATDSAQILKGEVAEEPTLPDKSKIVEDFRSYLQSKGILLKYLAEGRSNVEYDDEPISQANHARISIWQKDIDELPMVTPNFVDGLVIGTVTKWNDENLKYLTLNYTYWEIDEETNSTYPIITPDKAKEALEAGQSAVIIKPEGKQVSITEVYLAYYLPQIYTPYLQPVYVFQGPGFAAYVPAVDPSWLQQ
jgi:hypothetical protein